MILPLEMMHIGSLISALLEPMGTLHFRKTDGFVGRKTSTVFGSDQKRVIKRTICKLRLQFGVPSDLVILGGVIQLNAHIAHRVSSDQHINTCCAKPAVDIDGRKLL